MFLCQISSKSIDDFNDILWEILVTGRFARSPFMIPVLNRANTAQFSDLFSGKSNTKWNSSAELRAVKISSRYFQQCPAGYSQRWRTTLGVSEENFAFQLIANQTTAAGAKRKPRAHLEQSAPELDHVQWLGKLFELISFHCVSIDVTFHLCQGRATSLVLKYVFGTQHDCFVSLTKICDICDQALNHRRGI